MNRFEQLIEYVINDEEQKARELFHDIVVEKSRQIYEDLMAEEESTHDEDEKAEKAGRKVTKDIEYDDKRDRKEKMDEAEHDIDEAMGGDAADDLIDDVEMEEESDINMEDEDEEEVDVDMEMDDEDGDHHADVGGEEELEDRVMDLEDKLDELMAEFEALMGDEGNGDMMPGDEGGDAIEMDDTEEMMPEMGMTPPMPMEEAVSLKAAPKPVTSEEGSVNKKSTVAFNSGKAGMQGTPVDSDKGGEETGRPAPTAKDIMTDFQNKAGAGMKDQKPATKPQLGQAAGVNTRTPFPKG
jgi:hypothetical protein